MMLLTAMMLVECIIAAFGQTQVRKAREQELLIRKKTDEQPGGLSEQEFVPRGLSTVVLVLSELDTIARTVFPVFVCGIMLFKLLRLVPAHDDRESWNAMLVLFSLVFVLALGGSTVFSTRRIVATIDAKKSVQENKVQATRESPHDMSNPLSQDAATLDLDTC
jgi:hypothetical protein